MIDIIHNRTDKNHGESDGESAEFRVQVVHGGARAGRGDTPGTPVVLRGRATRLAAGERGPGRGRAVQLRGRGGRGRQGGKRRHAAHR